MKYITFYLRSFFFLIYSQFVKAETDIGSEGGDFFSDITDWLQDFVDFLEGPWGLFVPIAGLTLAITVWMFSTRGNESLGWVGRVVIGSIMLLTIPSLVVALKG